MACSSVSPLTPARQELAARLALCTPRPGDGVCERCFNLIGSHQSRCRACSRNESHLQAIAPVSYALSCGPLHRVLAAYKRGADPSVPQAVADVAELLDRFLSRHERCLGGGRCFALVTTVPSGERSRDELHPLRRIVRQLVPAVSSRHERLLVRTRSPVVPHVFDPGRFEARRDLHGESVLLIDDTWATGASAQSAAAALRAAGAGRVAALVIGRYLNRGWLDNTERVSCLHDRFDWDGCALCAARPSAALAA